LPRTLLDEFLAANMFQSSRVGTFILPMTPNGAVEPRASQIKKCEAFIDREAQSAPTPLIAGARATARKGVGAVLGSTAPIARIVSGASGPRYQC